MAFDNVVFPYYPMKHNIQKEIIDPVSVVSNGNLEYRIKRQSWERYKWTLPTMTMTNVQKEDIKSFLLNRNHALNSFKFVDPDSPAWVSSGLAFHSGVAWQINAPLNQITNITPGVHPLFNATVTSVMLDGVPTTPSAVYILDGRPVIDVPGSISSSQILVGAGVPYFTVRLASTSSYALVALDENNETAIANHSAIELIEVLGEY